MSRYIDADRLLADLPKLCKHISESNNCRACPLFNAEDDMCMVEDFIHSQPDADVKPITEPEQKKGNWIQTALGVLCSQCHYKCQSTGVLQFCPSCGARMGGMMI